MKHSLLHKVYFGISVASIMSFVDWAANAQLLVPFNVNFYGAVPGTIECEHFDHGGQGYAYNVLTNLNLGGKFRMSYNGQTEGVSIYENWSGGLNGGIGYSIGNTWANEWFSYLATVSETATYCIRVRARTAPGAQQNTTFHFGWNGNNNVTGTMTIANDGTWQLVSALTTQTLTATTAQLILYIDGGDSNVGCGYFDYITVYKRPPTPNAGSGSNTVSTLSSTYSYAAATNNAYLIQQAINGLGSAGGTVTLSQSGGPYYICQPTPTEAYPADPTQSSGPWTTSPLCTSTSNSSGTSIWNVSGAYVGMSFTNNSGAPLIVSALGRWMLSGNSQNHNIVLVNQNGLVLGQVNLNLANYNTPGQFIYTNFPNSATVTLTNGDVYAILSQESVGSTPDTWYDYNQNTTLLNPKAATGQSACYASTPTSAFVNLYTNASFVPVSLIYTNGIPLGPPNNYAILIGTNNVTISSSASPGTTLQAFNRDTTLFYLGYNWVNTLQIANSTFQNLNFVGAPSTDWAGFYSPTGIVWVDSIPTSASPIGTMLAIRGVNPTNALSDGIIIQSCTFTNLPSVAVGAWYTSDILITNCSFQYFTGNMSQSTIANIGSWCALLSQYPQPVYDILVSRNAYNGNVSMVAATDYAGDGLVWFGGGGRWAIDSNTITNYHLEAIQCNAGPYTVVANDYSTLSTCPSACALNTCNIGGAYTVNPTYYWVANTISGGGSGIRDPGDLVFSPYYLVASANQVGLGNISGSVATAIKLAVCQDAVITANALTSGQSYRAIAYQAGNSSQQTCAIYVLCNDFSAATDSTFFVQDGNNKLRSAVFDANRLGRGWDDSSYNNMGAHIALDFLPASPANPPQLFLQGNEFMAFASSTISPLSGPSPTLYAQSYNDYTGWLGCEFTVGSQSLLASYLGRWVLSGDSQNHSMQIVDTGAHILAYTTVDTANQPLGEYAYAVLTNNVTGANLTNGVVLTNGCTYYLVSEETKGGDVWWGYQNILTPSGATINAAVWSDSGTNNFNPDTGSYSFVPVNFIAPVIYPPVGNWTSYTSTYQLNETGQYYINNPSQWADATVSLF